MRKTVYNITHDADNVEDGQRYVYKLIGISIIRILKVTVGPYVVYTSRAWL